MQKYINRELSWLEFNQRVLDEARDPDVPLLERLKFLAITASNLDEFFMVRVGGLQQLALEGSTKRDPAGMTADEQLRAILQRTRQMTADQYACLLDTLEPALAEAGIRRLVDSHLSDRQAGSLRQVFDSEISPVLTPMAVEEGQEFPLLANMTLNLCVQLRGNSPRDPAMRFAIIPLGRSTRRFLTLHSDRGYAYMLLEDAGTMLVDRFFPGEEIEECVPFRITRDADMSVREDAAADLLEGIQEVLNERRQSPCVRLEIGQRAGEPLRSFLQRALGVSDESVFRLPGPLDLSAFMQLTDLHGFDNMKYDAWPPQPSPDVDLTSSMFQVISEHPVLLYHPYDSFEPVVRLIEEAADDPDVLAIKQTLYRTSRDSPIVAALERAAEQGKYVTALVELKARFDEQRNINWAKNLERAAVQVIYGVKGLKTHAKVCIIVRREPHGVQRYVHFGTGNYNESTARLYSDVSYMTCDEELGADATAFINAVTGYSQPQQFRKIEVAPLGLRERLLEMIEMEIQRKREGREARIVAKLNSLVDPQIINALYAASQAGVTIDLNVRGICCLRPGVPGLSDNVRVISIVDRFLEHARILFFLHGGDERVFISSADWMPRNLDRRVELLVPIEDEASRRRLIAILESYFRDNTKASRLLPDGTYQRITPQPREKRIRSQETLYRQRLAAAKRARESRRTVFEPYRAPGSNSS